ncbi:TadE/TadG family type IV pilus assembly protein [Chenggangzhangella methanolivorans]|uniref:Pilus assembly protein n=1 Tax=Chenggangzhangella methanolivorans TaxID=1437009 RepID=A0A9E6R8W9_9HYPH|nr:TadE/TadG family type IV pilus assembly protein [Chenggangzhangella methanolivorans]QZN99666.1 pilus assembly protein [Chenggangzhangella methanolivorans]
MLRRASARSRRSFAREDGGVAAIEFALFAPLLIALFLGCVEFVNAIDHRRKVNQVARTIADLTAQGDVQNPMSASLLRDIFASAVPIMAPYASALEEVRVLAVGVYAGKLGLPYVCSSWTTGSKPRSVGFAADIDVPDNFKRFGARYVVAEIRTPYRPVLGSLTSKFVKGLNLDFTWSEVASWPVRGGGAYTILTDAEVVLPNGKPCP